MEYYMGYTGYMGYMSCCSSEASTPTLYSDVEDAVDYRGETPDYLNLVGQSRQDGTCYELKVFETAAELMQIMD